MSRTEGHSATRSFAAGCQLSLDLTDTASLRFRRANRFRRFSSAHL